MTYNTIADIYAANEQVREQLVARVAGLSEAQLSYRPQADVWSAAEIVEHLAIIERGLTRVIQMLLHKAASASAESGTPPRPMQPFSLAEFAAQARTQKFVAPEEVRPTGTAKLADVLDNLRESRAALVALQPRIETTDGTLAQYPHPVFGPLNLYQWLAFIGLHEARHLHQIEGLLAGIGNE